MKYVEIEKLFTETVAKFIADGWIFQTETFNCRQDEIAKVDLQKGGDMVRVLLRKDMDALYRDFMEIEVRRYAGKAGLSGVFNEEGESLEQRKFYKVDKDWFVESEEEFGETRRKLKERCEAKCLPPKELGDKYRKIAWRWVKRNRKKSARLSDIEAVFKQGDGEGFLVATENRDYKIKAA